MDGVGAGTRHMQGKARGVNRSRVAPTRSIIRSAIGTQKRLRTACLLTPRALLIWDQDRPARGPRDEDYGWIVLCSASIATY
jgi:hypothetical protein